MGTEEAQQALVKYDVRSLPFVQLVATRRNATASSLPASPPPAPCRSSQTFPLPLFLLIFVARRCIHHVHRYAIVYNVLDTFCRRSIDSIDSIGGPEKGPPVGSIKTMLRLTAATEKPSGSYEDAQYAMHISHRSLRSDMEDLFIFASLIVPICINK